MSTIQSLEQQIASLPEAALDIYRKSEKDDLAKREIDFFKHLVQEYLRNE